MIMGGSVNGTHFERIKLDANVSLGIQSYSQKMIGMFNHLLSIVLRFHCHSQEVIGSLGYGNLEGFSLVNRALFGLVM